MNNTVPKEHVNRNNNENDNNNNGDLEEIPLAAQGDNANQSSQSGTIRIRIDRQALNQDDFDNTYAYRPTPDDQQNLLGWKIRKKFTKRGTTTTANTIWATILFRYLFTFLPISRWLPAYRTTNLLHDVIAGFTIGIMVVPQGMAYADLAGVDPIYGLYTSFFAPICYMIFGTSRHVSLGVFAVISLMVGAVHDRVLPNYNTIQNSNSKIEINNRQINDLEIQTRNASNISIFGMDSPAEKLSPIVLVSSLTLAIGLVQLLMALLQLSFLTAYLSDQVIGGFTTGAACHVLTSQLNKLLQVNVNRHTGLFRLFYTLKDMLLAISSANWVSCSISLACLIFLYMGKEFANPIFRRKFSVLLPFDLLAVVIVTICSYVFDLKSTHSVAVVDNIPSGLPKPTLPRFDLVTLVLTDAIGIAIVIFVVTVSVGKLFAKKHNYRINPAQELRGLGTTQLILSTLSCLPGSGSLTRSLLNSQIGVRSQLSNVFSCSLLLLVILWLGRLLNPLPVCVLASIIVVALKGMFMQMKDLKVLWPLSKIDFSIWIVSFLSTALWDVREGLAISVGFALLTVVFRSQWPKSVELGRLEDTDVYRTKFRYQKADSIPGLCIFRFDSPLLFTNVEMFKRMAHKLANISETVDEQTETDENQESECCLKAMIIDGSGFTYIDCMGVNALKEISQEMELRNICVYFAHCKEPVRSLFESTGFYGIVPKSNFYPTIHDAVLCFLSRNQQKSGFFDKNTGRTLEDAAEVGSVV